MQQAYAVGKQMLQLAVINPVGVRIADSGQQSGQAVLSNRACRSADLLS